MNKAYRGINPLLSLHLHSEVVPFEAITQTWYFPEISKKYKLYFTGSDVITRISSAERHLVSGKRGGFLGVNRFGSG